MKKIIKPMITILLFTQLLLQPYFSYALESDNDEPIYVQSDAAKYDNLTRLGEYTGNVMIDRGTTHITADYATTTTNEDGNLVEATAKGNADEQAHYWTLTDVDKPTFNAYADRMEYKAEEDKIYLYGNARVSQGDDLYTAPVIEYDISRNQVASPQSQEGRTTIIIHPNGNDTTLTFSHEYNVSPDTSNGIIS